jgi:hypothetical protein
MTFLAIAALLISGFLFGVLSAGLVGFTIRRGR